jgi:hypothetical protein
MPRRKQIYKITYPNGKIYVGMDLTGMAPDRFDLKLPKEILWESGAATDADVRAMKIKLIRETGANDPEIGPTTSCLVIAPTRWQVLASDG